MLENTLVSVIIPSYNGERHLEEAILSVFNQTYTNYELIIVDDGSTTDKVKKICDKYKDRLRYIRQDNNGLSAARNAGIKISKGEYIAFLDDDDQWLPQKLEKQVRLFRELKSKNVPVGLVYTGVEDMDEKGNRLYRTLYKSSGYQYEALKHIDFIGYGGSSAMIPKRVIDEVGDFDESLNRSEDYDLWIRISKKYHIYSVNEFLIKYRNRDSSLHLDSSKMVTGEMRILGKILADEAKEGLSKDDAKRLVRWYRLRAATRFKNTAYEYLFQRSDGRSFRKLIREGLVWDISPFDLNVWLYYLTSFISPRLCCIIKALKTKTPDILVNVDNLRFK